MGNSKCAVISGGTKGLGKALSFAFGKSGYYVISIFSSDIFSAEQFAIEFAEAGCFGKIVQWDITQEADEDLLALPEIYSAERLVLIHAACSSFEPKPFHLVSWKEVQSLIDVNLKGGWNCMRAILRPLLKAKEGIVVNVLTGALKSPMPPKGFSGYLAVKYALWGLTQSLAAEYGPRGKKFFCVAPGFMDTAMTVKWNEQLKKAARQSVESDPIQIAETILSAVENHSQLGEGEFISYIEDP